MEKHPSIPIHNPEANVRSIHDIDFIDSEETDAVVVDHGCCNDKDQPRLKLSGLDWIRSFTVGSCCFMYDGVLNLEGMSCLESLVIGENSFTKKREGFDDDPERRFRLKNCPKLKSLKMGRYSFSDYKVCEIENVDALEVIEIGELNKESDNFRYASLELKSILIYSE